MKITKKQLKQIIKESILQSIESILLNERSEMAPAGGDDSAPNDKTLERYYFKSAETNEIGYHISKAIHNAAEGLEAIAAGKDTLSVNIANQVQRTVLNKIGNSSTTKRYNPPFELPKGESAIDVFKKEALRRPWFVKLLKKYGQGYEHTVDSAIIFTEDEAKELTGNNNFKFDDIGVTSSSRGMRDITAREKLRKKYKGDARNTPEGLLSAYDDLKHIHPGIISLKIIVYFAMPAITAEIAASSKLADAGIWISQNSGNVKDMIKHFKEGEYSKMINAYLSTKTFSKNPLANDVLHKISSETVNFTGKKANPKIEEAKKELRKMQTWLESKDTKKQKVAKAIMNKLGKDLVAAQKISKSI